MHPLDALTLAIIGLMVLSLALWVLPTECKCDKCALHSYERRTAAEERRVKAHREYHTSPWFAVAWGDKHCQRCRDHADDQNR